MRKISRAAFGELMRKEIEQQGTIVLCGASGRASARGCEEGGADALLQYSCSAARMQGKSSIEGCLDSVDINGLNLSPAAEFQDITVPVVAGVYPADERYDMQCFLRRLSELGYSGICCFPSSEIYGHDREKDARVYRWAKELDMFRLAFVFSEEDAHFAAGMTDVVIFHLGMEAAARKLPLNEACARIDSMAGILGDIPVLVHGGPTIAPEDVSYICKHSAACGLLSGSTSDAAPLSRAVTAELMTMPGDIIASVADGASAKAAAEAGCGRIAVRARNRLPEVARNAPGKKILAELACYGDEPDWAALKAAGATGVINRPCLSRFSGSFARALEESGLDFSRETARLRAAKEAGLEAFAYAAGPEELAQAEVAGLDGCICAFEPGGDTKIPLFIDRDILERGGPGEAGSYCRETLQRRIRIETAQAVKDYKCLSST